MTHQINRDNHSDQVKTAEEDISRTSSEEEVMHTEVVVKENSTEEGAPAKTQEASTEVEAPVGTQEEAQEGTLELGDQLSLRTIDKGPR